MQFSINHDDFSFYIGSVKKTRGIPMGLVVFIIAIIIILSALNSFAKKANAASASGQPSVTPAALGKKLFSAMTSSTRNESWIQVAETLGLTYIAPKSPFDTPVITGKIAGRNVDISMVEGAPGVYETIFKVKMPRNLDIGLLISKDKQSVQNRLFSGRKRFANIDFEPGNIENVIASAFDEKEFKKFLSKRRSNILMNLLGLYQFVNITDDTITVRIPGLALGSEKLQTTVRALIKVSEILGVDTDENDDSDSDISAPVSDPEALELIQPAVKPKLTIPSKIPATVKPSVLTDMAVPAAVSTATVMSAAESSKSISEAMKASSQKSATLSGGFQGQKPTSVNMAVPNAVSNATVMSTAESSKSIFEAQKASAQKSAGLSGGFQGHKPTVISELGRAPAMKQDTFINTSKAGFKPVDEKKPESGSQIHDVQPSGDLTEQKYLCEALFSVSFPGAKEKEIFDKVKGAQIKWNGVLKTVYEYSSDFVFGSVPGTKATFEIHEITGNYSMKTKIKAVVQLPKDAFQTLRTQTEKEFTFSGKIEKLEAFSKEIYVSSGNIV